MSRVPVPGLSSSAGQAVESAGLLRFCSKFDSVGFESKRRDGTSLPMNIAHMSGSSLHGGFDVLDPYTFFEKIGAESVHSGAIDVETHQKQADGPQLAHRNHQEYRGTLILATDG